MELPIRCTLFNFVVCVTLFFDFFTLTPFVNSSFADEARLYDELLQGYNKHIRPAENTSQTVRVDFGMALIKLVDVHESFGSIKVQVWFREQWIDTRLRWDPEAYDKISVMRIPANLLWGPDMMLYNTVRDTGVITREDIYSVISSDGSVLVVTPAIIETMCSFDLTMFPFDKQMCTFKFGSWTYDGFKVDPELYDGMEMIDLSDFIADNEWRIIDTKARKNVKYYPCCAEPYPDITFTIQMQRYHTYFSCFLIGPTLLMSLLTPVVFILPAKGCHRYILGGALLVSMTVAMGNFEAIQPGGMGGLPIIVVYYVAVAVNLAVCLFISAIVTNIASKESSPPRIIKSIFTGCLGRILCVSSVEDNAYVDYTVGDDDDDNLRIAKPAATSQSHDWHLIASVLDRLFFIVFLALTILFAFIFIGRL